MVILVDDEDRENEGDLCMAAELVTPEAINFMATHGRGLICLTLTEERIAKLQLPMMVPDNRAPMGTAFTVSIEARVGVTTGISAADRAVTVRTAVAPGARPDDLVSPGHVFPLKARRGGVLVRTGQTEGSVDMARLAGLEPAGVICEIMRDDGTMARMPDLEVFAARHGLMILSIADLIEYRLQSERLVRRIAEGPFVAERFAGVGAAPAGELRGFTYASDVDPSEYLALVRGDVAASGAPVLVRVQAMCPVGDVFGVPTCDCSAQLGASLDAIAREGRGVLLYVHPRERTSLVASFRQHVLHQGGETATPGPGALREFGLGAQVLADLGLRRIRLLTNNPKKIVGVEGFGIEIAERVAIHVAPAASAGWLDDRREREGYLVRASAATTVEPMTEVRK